MARKKTPAEAAADAFREGKGVFIVNHGELSPTMIQANKGRVGRDIVEHIELERDPRG